MPDSGDVYTATIYFKGLSGNCKIRPVLVLNDLKNGWYTIAEITSVAPKNPPGYYDLFKEAIIKWQECGLDEPSYVKCNNNNIHPKFGDIFYQYLICQGLRLVNSNNVVLIYWLVYYQ